MARKPKQKRLPKVCWREIERTPGGCQRWESADGMLRLLCIDQYEGIPMKRVWVLWQYLGGYWLNVFESRSRKAVEKLASEIIAALESDD